MLGLYGAVFYGLPTTDVEGEIISTSVMELYVITTELEEFVVDIRIE